jgi:hypothetical protein
VRETNKARKAFEDYYQMGPPRSLRVLLALYCQQTANKPPTKRFRTLAAWSTTHGWQERVRQRDQEIADAQMAHIKATATSTGYAIYQQRIHDLGVLAMRFFKLLEVGALQPGAIREYRGLLADIAAEMGDREKKHKVTLDWQSDIVELLRNGQLDPQIAIDELGYDLAEELFISAGLSISESGEAQTPS